jgi:hypothetical protein
VPEHEHDWRLAETGYVRTWRLEFDDESKTIKASYGGSEDWSEHGNQDDHLMCGTCLETKPLPDGWEVEFS